MQCVHQLFLPRMKSPRNTSTAFTSHDSFARVSLHVVVDTRMMSDDWLFSPVNGGQRVDDQFGLRVFFGACSTAGPRQPRAGWPLHLRGLQHQTLDAVQESNLLV